MLIQEYPDIYIWGDRTENPDSGTNLKLNNSNDHLVGRINFEAALAAQFQVDPTITSGLTIGYRGGIVGTEAVPVTVAAGTKSLTALATNYLQVNRASGTVTVATTIGAGNIPLHRLVTDAGGITAWTDLRGWTFKGLGDVNGPASAVDNAVPRFDTTTGKLLQASPVIVADAGDIYQPDQAEPGATGNKSYWVGGAQKVDGKFTGRWTGPVPTGAGLVGNTAGGLLEPLAVGTGLLLADGTLSSNATAPILKAEVLTSSHFRSPSDDGSMPAHSRVGNVITFSAPGVCPAIGGEVPTLNSRVLFQHEGIGYAAGIDPDTGDPFSAGTTNGHDYENGIWVMTVEGDVSTACQFARATDCDTSAEIYNSRVYVARGVRGGKEYLMNVPQPIVLNTTGIYYVKNNERLVLTVEEADGAPSVAGVSKIRVPNGSLTNVGSGVVSIQGSTVGNAVFIAANAGAAQTALSLVPGTDVASLSGGKVPSGQLPSYVDDVLEFANLAAFPGTGETGKIYVALDSNFTYRWSGSAYVRIGDGGENYTLVANEAALPGTGATGILYLAEDSGDEYRWTGSAYQKLNQGIRDTDNEWTGLNRFDKGLLLTSDTPATIGANQDDYSAGFQPVLRLSASAGYTISGLAGGVDDMMRVIRNVGGQPFDLLNEGSGSTAVNRFALKGSVDYGMQPGDSITVLYDGVSERWCEIARSTSINAGLSGTASGDIDMDGYALTGLPVPGSSNAAARKQDVEDVFDRILCVGGEVLVIGDSVAHI